jgi:uncharacterized protein (DUF58 family)
VRPRRRAIGLVLGAGVLYLIGTNAQAGWLFVLAVLLLGAVAAGAVLPVNAVRRLEVDVSAPAETRQGAPTAVQVRITNRGRSTRWGVVAHDEHLGGATTWVGTIRPGETVTMTSGRGAPRRGEAHPGWVELRSAAPFGVAERRRRLPVEGTTLVLPSTLPLAAPSFIETAMAREASARTEPRRGAGPEYLGVREYRPGDPVRQVHWRLTARHGELVVRDLEEERMPRLAIWLDTPSDVLALDRCCTIAASVLDAATATGAGVRLAAATSEGPVTASRARAIDLHRWLARLEPSGVDSATALGWVDGETLRGIGTLVVIVSGPPPAGMTEAVETLAPWVARVVVIVSGEEAALAEDPGMRGLLSVGAEILPWVDDVGLAPAIRRAVEVPA